LESLVDGLNREVSVDELRQNFERVRKVYRAAKAEHLLQLGATGTPAESAARWILRQLAAD
jgi:hypothetical protein